MKILIILSVLVTLFCCEISFIECDELVGLITLSRHGQRTPVVSIPNDTRKIHWSAEPGELLNSGKNLQYNLGKWFRTRYRTFLPAKYSPKDIHIQSTDVDRVLMSAYCNLAGLYPPRGSDIWKWTINWQPIPVHVMPNYYLFGAAVSCDKFFDTWTNYVYNSEIYNKENMEMYQYISDNLGIDISKNPISLIEYYDTFYTQKINGYKLPKWAEPVFTKWQNIVRLLIQSQSNTTEMAQMTLGGFAGHIVNHFDSVINGTNEYKYSMNFGHDFNVAGFLNILTHKKATLPYFGCSLLFEMHKDQNTNYIKLFYKNKDALTEVQIKGCGVQCDYESFKSILKEFVITEDGWNKLCQKGQQKE